MTREEAISKYIVPALKNTWNDKINNEVIKALEQEPCEDAIKKTDIVELLRHGRTYALHHPEQYKTEREADIVDTLYVNLIQAVDKLPPVNPQPKTGYWILTSDDDCEYCTCSECGYQNGENWMIGSQIKFCQECGAKMIEPQESEG